MSVRPLGAHLVLSAVGESIPGREFPDRAGQGREELRLIVDQHGHPKQL